MSVNGVVCLNPVERVSHGHRVQVDGGEPICKTSTTPRLWSYHKPAGLLCTHEDSHGRPTVFDSLRATGRLPRVMSVGRLDLETEGLLLLTDCGHLKRFLELPSSGYVRRYQALLHTGKERSVTSQVGVHS